jgi:hypothetical protein
MVDKLFNMELLNNCKATKLLAAMVKLRPADDAHHMEVQILLAKEEVKIMNF